jgi:hypothetical protein
MTVTSADGTLIAPDDSKNDAVSWLIQLMVSTLHVNVHSRRRSLIIEWCFWT